MQAKRLLWIVALGLGFALTLALLMALSPSPEMAHAASNDWFVEADGAGIACTQANPCAHCWPTSRTGSPSKAHAHCGQIANQQIANGGKK